MKRSIVVALSALVAAAVVAVPAAVSRASSGDESTAPAPIGGRPTPASKIWAGLGIGAGSQAEHFNDVPTMARKAGVVVQARVKRVYPTRLVGRGGPGGNPAVQMFGLELGITQILDGRFWNEDETRGRVVVETTGRPKREDGPLEGVFFLVHKKGHYYRFISSQGVLTRDAEGSPVFPVSTGDSANEAIRRSVAGKTYDEVITAVTDHAGQPPMFMGVTDCASGYSFGSTADYFEGGGEPTAEVAIGYLSRAVAREYGSSLQPRTMASSDTRVVVEYPVGSRVMARGAVILVGGKWQMEGLSQCSMHPAVADEGKA